MTPEDRPWRVPVRLADLGGRARTMTLEADASALDRIAKALGIDALLRLRASVSVTPWLDGVAVGGRWDAAVVQTCGVSLDPFTTELGGEFEIKAVPPASPAAQRAEEAAEIDLEAEDPPDVLESDSVDVGDYVVEHMALAIDPFPRAPGVVFEPPPAEAPPSPFAVLARLKPPE